jgi:hypothetical protein
MPDNSNQKTGEGSAVIKHFEALIERAARVRSNKRGNLFVIGLRVQGPNKQKRKIHDVFSNSIKDQHRLKGLCRALQIDPLLFTLDDLVGRKLDVAEKAQMSKTGLHTIDLSYLPLERRPQKQKNDACL